MRACFIAYFVFLASAFFTVQLTAADQRTGIHPVVGVEKSSECLLIGGTIDGKWADANSIAPHLKGNEHYKLYSTAKYLETSVGSKPKKENDHYLIQFPKSLNNCEIGIAGGWDPAPRNPATVRTDRKEYADAIRKLLDSKGFKKSRINILKALKVDLEGDGQDEVLISAESKDYDPIKYVKGQYSLILLRKIVDGKVQNIVICSDLRQEPDPAAYPEKYRIGGMWDVDGDGRLEIAVFWSCQRADVAGLALYDMKGEKPVLLAQDGVGH